MTILYLVVLKEHLEYKNIKSVTGSIKRIAGMQHCLT